MNKCEKKYTVIALIVFLSFAFLLYGNVARAVSIDDLQAEIKKQADSIKDLKRQQEEYQKKLEKVRKEAKTLRNEVSYLNDTIAKTSLEIKEKETTLKKIGLEIQELQYRIEKKKQAIGGNREILADVLNSISRSASSNQLIAFFSHRSLSDFLSQKRLLASVSSDLNRNLDKLKIIKEGFETQERAMREKQQEEINVKNELVSLKEDSADTKEEKNRLLKDSEGAEWKFQNLLAEAVREQKNTEAEIENLEKSVRRQLAIQEEERLSALEEGDTIVFSWPIPKNKITTYFHDPEYPFKKYLGEHSGIDVRASQGTAIRAPAGGYVGKVRNGGLKRYSYIMLLHKNGLATVYGHVSKISVREGDYVKRGDIIGNTGGLPGTPGAGPFSTGAHLHFEVRQDGLPANPLEFMAQ
ncbi:MAG: peptidoglycan DD-metalloendopeptidase family protein [Parcubacteria group bacterium]|nr:peptidoglycan DD-metalloendopeptidase family protein [Parcubacteria group bacterium]